MVNILAKSAPTPARKEKWKIKTIEKAYFPLISSLPKFTQLLVPNVSQTHLLKGVTYEIYLCCRELDEISSCSCSCLSIVSMTDIRFTMLIKEFKNC